MTSGREAAFLEAMGITPMWQARVAPARANAADIAEAAEPADSAEPVAAAGLVSASDFVAAAAAAYGDAYRPAPTAAPEPLAPAVDTGAEAIARMDWAQLRAAVAGCTRCGLCKPGQQPVMGVGPEQADWLVTAGALSALEEAAQAPVAGEPGKLLDNMLFAVGKSRATNAYVTHVIKCRPVKSNGADRVPTAEEAAACRPYLLRELALSGARTILSLGQIAANTWQDKPFNEALASSRGQVHMVHDARLVATLHPAELLRRGPAKALAWADLCRAKAVDELGAQ